MSLEKLKHFLDDQNVEYSVITHPLAYTAQEVAHAAHIAGSRIAKTIIVKIDDKMAMAVLPANQKVVLQDLREITGVHDIQLAAENEFSNLFPGCETGAMPPFGNFYGMDVYVSPNVANQEEIVFNAGTHRDLIKMAYSDFERLVQPKVLSFTT
jgi:Ala-tRNA(Pro) deacylase